MRQVVCALLMRYRLGLGGQANTFGCLRSKVPYNTRVLQICLHYLLMLVVYCFPVALSLHTLAELQVLFLT